MERLKWLTFLLVTTASGSLAVNVPLEADRATSISNFLLPISTLPVGITALIPDDGSSMASSAELPPGIAFVKITGQGNYVPQYVLDLDPISSSFVQYLKPPWPPGSYAPPNMPPCPPPPSPPPRPPPLPPGPSFTIIDFTQLGTVSARSMIRLEAGQDLTLASLTLYLVSVKDSLGALMNAQLSNLALSNTVISVPENATLRLHNVTVIVKGLEFSAFLFTRLCINATSWPYTADVELRADGIYISTLTTRAPDGQGRRGMGGVVEWRDVTLTFSRPSYYNRGCAAFAVSDGSELLRITREVLNVSSSFVYISITANVTLPPTDDSWQPISVRGPSSYSPPKLVLLGNPNTKSILDLAGRANVWVARDIDWPESNITSVVTVVKMYDLTLVNLPYLSARPNGAMSLLASGLHSFTIRRGMLKAGSSSPYLTVERCTLVVPDPEVEFLEGALRNASGAWPRGGFQSQRDNDTAAIEGQLKVARMQLMLEVQLSNSVLMSASRYSALPDSVQLLPQSRLWLPQLLAAKDNDTYRQLGPGGLAVFYGIDGALRDMQSYSSLLGYTVRLVSRRLDDSILGLNVGYAPVLNLSVSDTERKPSDPASPPARCILDSFPEEVLGGKVFVDLKGVVGRVELARPITLQNLVLYNLAPRGVYPLSYGGLATPLTGVDAAWIGSTLPLWLFSFDRSAQGLPQGFSSVGEVPSATTASSPASWPLLQLFNVTLVVPEAEWRAMVATILWQHAPEAMKAAQKEQDGEGSPPKAPANSNGPPTGSPVLPRISSGNVEDAAGSVDDAALKNQQTKLTRRMTGEQQPRLSSDNHHESSQHPKQRRIQALLNGTVTSPQQKLLLMLPFTPTRPPPPLPPPPLPPSPPMPPAPPPSPPYTKTTRFALGAFAAASRIRSYNFGSGVLVLDTATHYGWTGINITLTRGMPADAPEAAVLLSYPSFELPYSNLASDDINLDVQVGLPPPPASSPQPTTTTSPSPPSPCSEQSQQTPFPPLLRRIRPPNVAPSPAPPDQGPPAAAVQHTSGRPSWVVPVSATLSSTFGVLLVVVTACVLLVKVRTHRKKGGLKDVTSSDSQNGAGVSTEDVGILCSSVSIRVNDFAATVCQGKKLAGSKYGLGGLTNKGHDVADSSGLDLTPPVTGFNLAGTAAAPAGAKAARYMQSASTASTAEDGAPTACLDCTTCVVPSDSMPDAATVEDTTTTTFLEGTIPMASTDGGRKKGGHGINVDQALAKWHESLTISTLPPASMSITKGSMVWKKNRDVVTRVVAISLGRSRNTSTQLMPANNTDAKTETNLAQVDMAAALPPARHYPEDDTVFHRELQTYFQELMGHSQEISASKTDMEATFESEVTTAAEFPTVLQPRQASDLGGLHALKKSIRHLQVKLDDYGLEICSVIDMGAYGVVYCGSWRGLAVAVKTLVVAEGAAVSRPRAVLEAAISLSMAHPHVVATYAYDIKPLVQQPQPGALNITGDDVTSQHNLDSCDAFKLHIVQEFCNGGTLLQALERGMAGSVRAGGLPRVLALRFALDIALGLSHIHTCRIVHGDLKPDNVLLALDSTNTMPKSLEPQPSMQPAITAKVADFGLSLPLQGNATHASGQFHGTPAYVAPEVFASGKLSPSSDVWSFGVVLLELYYGCTLVEITTIHAQLSGVPNTVSMQPLVNFLLQDVMASPQRPYASLVAACLAQEPRARPTLAEVVPNLQALYDNAKAGAFAHR